MFRPEADRNTRCLDCRERAKVYLHQLHKRRGAGHGRFLSHDCKLCRKHRAHVQALHRRWDERGAWMIYTCAAAGHRELRDGKHKPCGPCMLEWNRRVMKTMKVH